MILGSLLIVATPHVFCAIMYLFFLLSSVCSVLSTVCQRTLCCILTYALCLPQTYMCVLYTYIVYMCVPSICVPFISCVSMYIFSILQSVWSVLCCQRTPSPAFWWIASLCLSFFFINVYVCSLYLCCLWICALYMCSLALYMCSLHILSIYYMFSIISTRESCLYICSLFCPETRSSPSCRMSLTLCVLSINVFSL